MDRWRSTFSSDAAKKERTQWKPDSHSSLWVLVRSLGGNRSSRRRLLPPNISPWFCQPVLMKPFCFLADSSTIPSEMLIWKLSVSLSQPSPHIFISPGCYHSLPYSVPLSPLVDVHSVTSRGVKLSAYLKFRLQRRSADVYMLRSPRRGERKKNSHIPLKNDSSSQFANAVTFLSIILKRANFRHLYLLGVWMKALISGQTSSGCPFSLPKSPRVLYGTEESRHRKHQIISDIDA